MLDKHYDHQSLEARWYRAWESNHCFRSQPDPNRQSYSMVIPPPNVTGILHIGHILNNTVQDILARFKRMQGFNVTWVPGTDHAGIATQNMVEKHLRKEGIDPDSLSREEFLAKVWEWKEEYGGVIIQQLRKLGASCDWEREAFTLDETRSKAVFTMFKHLYDKQWIYRGKYIVNWCPTLQTALSDDEVDRSEEPSHLWHFRYPVVGEDTYLVVATTRPETMLGDTGVAVHPEDERYQHLIGKKVLLPIVQREIPIFGDEHVDRSFGTGCVKVTPAHDKDDFEMGIKHQLPMIVIMNKRAIMNENVPIAFQGLSREDARKKVVATMKDLGLLEKIEDHTVAVGRCYRTKDIIEPYLSEQWFVKMDTLAEMALKPVQDGTIRFYPDRWVNTYNHWLTNIRDWCISRQLRWGHRIPVWYCGDCQGQTCDIDTPSACSHCGSANLEQDPDVLDTWASSWLWPFSVFGWPEDTEDLAYYYPTQTLVTAADIIFFWVARMIMAGLEFKGTVPFTDVCFNGIVRDMEGRKMSKTLGNSPDPLDIIATYGADALRFTIVYNTPYGEDTRFSEESCDLGKGFATKIWNANRFLQMTFEGVEADPNWQQAEPDIIGTWILSRLSQTITGMEDDLANYRFAAAASRIYNFFWGEFCDWYVEFLKPAQRNASEAERAVLLGRTRYVIESCLRLLHPFMPFVTEELWHQLRDREPQSFLMQQSWPEAKPTHVQPRIEEAVAVLQQLITGIRAARKSYSLSHNASLVLHLLGDDEKRQQFADIEPVLLKMAGLESYHFLDSQNPPQGCTPISIPGMSAYLDLRGHLDTEKELAKIDLKIAKLEKELKPLQGRLANPKFTENAPASVVETVQQQATELERQIHALHQSREEFQKLGDT